MSAEAKLRQALSAIDDARRRLNRAKNELNDDELQHQLRRAVHELDDAEADIQRAISELRR